MMKRILLLAVTLGLLVLMAVDRISHLAVTALGTSGPAVDASASTAHGATHGSSSGGAAVVPEGARADLAGDRLTRLATRRQLIRDAGQTYIDSLIGSTDSVVRRWPNRTAPLKVAIVDGGPREWTPQMAGYVREALTRWSGIGTGLRFVEVGDSLGADITVHWIDRFAFDRAGQTDLTWDQLGRVRRASIALAVRTSAGLPLPARALLAVAVHETGHALGLPHSADSADVMFPATRTGAISDRDRRTAVLLYQLPPGPLRDEVSASR
jgi:predicted Zn-dependent protease